MKECKIICDGKEVASIENTKEGLLVKCSDACKKMCEKMCGEGCC